MTDADFAAIQAAFPTVKRLGRQVVGWDASLWSIYAVGGRWMAAHVCYESITRTSLPDCLTALRAAIVAERDQLNKIIGEVP